jgi:hypothetical protein
MRRRTAALAVFAALLVTAGAVAHITPNVTLVRRGDFVKQALPGASKYFEQSLDGPSVRAVQAATGWAPSGEDTRIYVGRDEQGHPVGRVVFLWLPSEHGPVGIGVAFDAGGRIRQAAVTDVGTEPLAWVRPILDGLGVLSDLEPDSAPDPRRIAPAAKGTMSRYYAEVIAGGVTRTQAVDRALRSSASSAVR